MISINLFILFLLSTSRYFSISLPIFTLWYDRSLSNNRRGCIHWITPNFFRNSDSFLRCPRSSCKSLLWISSIHLIEFIRRNFSTSPSQIIYLIGIHCFKKSSVLKRLRSLMVFVPVLNTREISYLLFGLILETSWFWIARRSCQTFANQLHHHIFMSFSLWLTLTRLGCRFHMLLGKDAKLIFRCQDFGLRTFALNLLLLFYDRTCCV